jgi:hypothetical protein
VNRPESALAAFLLAIAVAAPTAAQQVPLTPRAPVSEFCSGCFAYLEFPPLPEDEVPPSRASTHQDASAATTVAPESPIVPLTPGLVVSIKQ